MDSHEIKASLNILQDHVLKHYEDNQYSEDWCRLPEIPGKAEMMPNPVIKREEVEHWDDYQKDPIYDPKLPNNIIDGPWPDKMEYIGAHYQILREDAIAPLRKSIDDFRKHQQMGDREDTHIYTEVYVRGLVLSPIGPAFHLTFATDAYGKRIRWKNSKRLQQGTIVALSTERDMFNSICKIATVAARPLSGLSKNPPEVDIFFGDINDAIINPSEKYIMIEARTGYFEASRHMLVAMQKLLHERFQLQKHLVQLDPNLGAPKHLEEQPVMNLNSLIRFKDEGERFDYDESLQSIDVLTSFPTIPKSGMDSSQMEACERMLVKKLAIVQGPPGTGKTFTSVKTLRALIENSEPGGPPVIIAAQTNHALDQLLNHVLEFEPEILRLGGRSSFENKVIRSRTLYELRLSKGQEVPNGNQGLKHAHRNLESLVERLKKTMAPLLQENLLTEEYLLREKFITQAQYDSLHEPGWATAQPIDNVHGVTTSRIEQWLGRNQLIPVPCTPQINFGLQAEPEYDEDLEDQEEMELDPELEGGIGASTEDEKDALLGQQVRYGRKLTGAASTTTSAEKIKRLLKKNSNLFNIADGSRGTIYRYWEKKSNEKVQEEVIVILRDNYAKLVQETKITKWMCNIRLINHLGIKVVGCTTTGLAKYRGLISALHPRTLLIEEAAETLEGTIIAGMFDSLERLILVGDHKQLQAHCNTRALEVEPYHLNVSMFERLINNGIPYTMLNEQRRMIPDIRKLLCLKPNPFYKGLHDHPSVLDRKINRPRIPGMGGRDVYFFHHNWPETRNEDFSMVNTDEAQMIAGFFKYLTLNGTPVEKITVLSFYTGQKKKILSILKDRNCMGREQYLDVQTVDSFQGEENDIILLSLVRSNTYLSIGFLESQNRLVVALSRARRGLYIFGNVVTLLGREGSYEERLGVSRDPLWGPLMEHMSRNRQLNIDKGLPITCENHKKTLEIREANDWSLITAGCKEKCLGKLPCGHECPYHCHVFKHEDVICKVPCPRSVPRCGHGCSRNCGEQCYCSGCAMNDQALPLDRFVAHRDEEEAQLASSASSHLHPSKPLAQSALTSRHTSHFAQQDIRLAGGSRFREMPANFIAAHRKNSFERGRSPFGSPTNVTRSPGPAPGSAEKWRAWNSEKADRAVFEKQRAAASAAEPKPQRSQTIFHETFRPVKANDGVRVKGAAVYNIVGGDSSTTTKDVKTFFGGNNRNVENRPPPVSRLLYPQATLTPVEPNVMATNRNPSALCDKTPPKPATNLMITPAVEMDDVFGMGFATMSLNTGKQSELPSNIASSGDAGSMDLMSFDISSTEDVGEAAVGGEEALIEF